MNYKQLLEKVLMESKVSPYVWYQKGKKLDAYVSVINNKYVYKIFDGREIIKTGEESDLPAAKKKVFSIIGE